VTTAWGTSWLLEPVLKSGSRAVLVTDVTDEDLALPSYEPPTVSGMKPTRLGPGVFGYKSGATLLVWPVNRHVSNLPNSSHLFRVVLDPSILDPQLAMVAMTISYTARWGLNELSTVEMGLSVTARTGIAGSDFAVGSRSKVSIQAIRDKGSAHLTMPFVCGNAAGNLLQSKVGKWLAEPMPATVVLRDSLGRSAQMHDVMPTLDISAMGKKFRLCAEVSTEILFTEIHG
jgi:hypothetical protein